MKFPSIDLRIVHRGLYDVRTEGGRGVPWGVPSKADIVRNFSKGGCVNLRTRGEGVKKSKNIADVINGSPQRKVDATGSQLSPEELLLLSVLAK